MDIQTLIMPVIVIAFGLFAGATFVYRKMTVGETFKLEKFLPTMGIGGLAALVLYLASGVFPSIDTIFTQIEVMAPGGVPSLTVIIAALLAVYNSLVKSVAATPVSTPATQAATVEQAKSTLPAETQAPEVIKTITATGPFWGHDSNVSLTGTRIIQAPGGAFQVINDDVTKDFIAGGAGENAIFSGEFKFSGNLTLITYGELY